jgi:hypothetical protein
MKMYVNMENLNEYEKEHNKISYKTLVERYFDNMILCNNIANNYEDLEVIAGSDYDEEEDTYKDIYQYFIVDGCFDEEDLQKVGEELGVVYYNSNLDLYILGVDHFGTSWDYVLTDIEPTENLNESL